MIDLNLPAYASLGIAITAEVLATSALKWSNGFTALVPTVVCLACYGVAFFFLSLALKQIPIGIAYGVWSAVGVICISAIGWIVFKQELDFAAIAGLSLIISGVIVIQLYSSTSNI